MASKIAASVQTTGSRLLRKVLPASPFTANPTDLYPILARLPLDGVGSRVRQQRWDLKGFHDTYWEVTRVKLKNEGQNGKVWGKFYWKGEQ